MLVLFSSIEDKQLSRLCKKLYKILKKPEVNIYKINKIIDLYVEPIHLVSGQKDISIEGLDFHYLKTHPEYFNALIEENPLRRKTFEARVNDRNYAVGDILILEEYIPFECSIIIPGSLTPVHGEYTGRRTIRIVTYILEKQPFVTPEYIIMGLAEV